MSPTPQYTIDPNPTGERGREIRVFGPPGTGKTTFLSGRIRATALARGGNNVLVASFTVTAAQELKGRGLSLPKSNIGTLHSLAYRALDRPPVADEQIDEWNTEHPAYARTGSRKANLDDGAPLEAGMGGATSGDALAAQLDALRARRTPREQWPTDVRAFADKWEDWKRANGLIDFCMDEQTEVFTHRGWVNGHDIRDGDLVRCLDPATGLAEWQPVESVYRRQGKAAMIHMTNTAHDSLTTPDHRWLTASTFKPGLHWTTTADLCSTHRIPRAAAGSDAPTTAKYDDAFVELVAWWYTEGSYRVGNGHGGNIGQSYRVNPEHEQRIEACLTTLYGPPTIRPHGQLLWSKSTSERRGMSFYSLGATVVDELDAAGGDKVPSMAFLSELTTAQLRLFVETSMDADGHRRRNAWVFEQVDRRRTEAFAAAAILAGMAVTFHEREVTNGSAWSVTVSDRRTRAVVPGTTGGHATGTRTMVEYDGLIWCPTVREHHNFLARRRGRTYYTGNTDMIEYAAQDVKVAPGAPEVGFFDEVQDFTPLELSLIRQWGGAMERIILAGDDDQAIYGFKGAEPDAFLKPDIPDADKIVLSQSWRVPAAVHRAAEHWIRQVSYREDKRYDPREEEGAVRQIGASYNEPLQLIDAVEAALAETVTDPDGTERPATVMILATCGYMLDPAKHEMRKRGLPFHNPFRVSRGDWNPMRPATNEKQVTSRERLLAYLTLDEREDSGIGDQARPWTGEDVRRWAHVIKKQGIFRRGAAAALEGLSSGELGFDEVAALFANEVELEQAVTPDLGWFERNLLASSRAAMTFPIEVARQRGARALLTEPRVVLGTIHSVKGGQADCSPPDEPVLTTNRGWVPIAELDPETDRLVSFNSDHHKIHRGGPRRPDGYAFTMGSREYAGPMLTLTTPASRTRVTPNHHLTVRWNAAAMKAHAVYLMRRGDRWRIGMTAMRHGDNGQSGPLMRGRREGADAVWLLSLHHSRAEAALTEQHLAWTFGVPDTTWRAGRGQSQDQLDRFWNLLAIQSEQGAKELLALHGQDAAWPMWDITADVTRRQAGRRNRWQIRAANLMPRWMQLPTDPGHGQEPVWHDVEVTSAPYDGRVYSLDVERWHHYVSGGAVVHNCVFLIPDLSSRGSNEWRQRGRPQDGVRRQMYVGMTRAKRELVLCGAGSGMFVPPEQMIAGFRR